MKVYIHSWYVGSFGTQLHVRTFPWADLDKEPVCACCFPPAVFAGLQI